MSHFIVENQNSFLIIIMISKQKPMKSPIIEEPDIKKLENNKKYISDDKGNNIQFESLDVNNICKTLNIHNGKKIKIIIIK
jgi:hypothetical protein